MREITDTDETMVGDIEDVDNSNSISMEAASVVTASTEAMVASAGNISAVNGISEMTAKDEVVEADPDSSTCSAMTLETLSEDVMLGSEAGSSTTSGHHHHHHINHPLMTPTSPRSVTNASMSASGKTTHFCLFQITGFPVAKHKTYFYCKLQ
jgi:hypothetical protein